MTKDTLFVHMGHRHFDAQNGFRPIVNRDHFVKPMGGLWGSPVDSPYGWEEWVKDNNFNSLTGNKYDGKQFSFKLTEAANVLEITSAGQLDNLPQIKDDITSSCFVSLDFDKLAQEYDAMIVYISADNELYWKLYGWDVDSILVFNPNVVIEVDSKE